MDSADQRFGDREALVSLHQGIKKTFSEAKLEADKLAAAFLSLGLQRGERIGIWGQNTYEWYLTQYAAAKAGLILVNINPMYQANELKFCLNEVSVKALVCDESFKTTNYYQMLCQVAPELSNSVKGEFQSKTLPSLKTIIMMTNQNYSGIYRFKDVCEAGESTHLKELESLSKKIQFDEPGNIQFTSGTTGQPKGSVLSHHGLVNNAYAVGYRSGYAKKAHRIILPVPLNHSFGCVLGTLTAAHFGATCVLPSSSYDPKATVQALQDEKITSCYGTPTMFVDFLNVQRSKKCNMQNLSTAVMGAAPCPKELILAVTEELHMKNILVMYGTTETSPITFHSYTDDPPNVRATTIGYPGDHVEVKVIDNDGNITRIGKPGELCIRGYCSFLGYWNNPEKTKEVLLESRWYKTG
ncbi:Acyl-CoA synthetase member 2 mitochondrial [Halocaridina rubra]|uniref:Medium-chain acyl-CoA ligase ACSF2, mitochondrial n=1 Tax=Halocaridina rubra TaxID=373956 RepID=A0AAN8XEB5_HALRR